MDPKPAPRIRASKEEWAGIHKGFVNERCWVCGGSWSDLHHIVSRAHSGDDVVANLAPLCRACHTAVEERDLHARSKLRQALLPSNYHYLLGKLGVSFEGWLERNYPVRIAA